jgi:hypothetical protein
MRCLQMNSRRRMMLAQVMLGLLLLRAYVPVGYMPQSGNPLQLQMCSGNRASAATQVLLEQTRGHLSHAADCPFGHAPVTGPVGGLLVATAAQIEFAAPWRAFDTTPAIIRVLLAHQARAPPTLA